MRRRDPGVPSQVNPVTFCFIRNVLTRTLANVLVDIGSTSEITTLAVSHVDITASPPKNMSPGELQPLTPELRADLAQRITGGILKLATTYRDTTAFRDIVLRSCPRGIELERHYDAT